MTGSNGIFGGGQLVSNSDFNSYRNKTGIGQDFALFSDLLEIPLSVPDIIIK